MAAELEPESTTVPATQRTKARNPHDRFFKAAFRHQDVARAEIARMLTPQILRHLDLEALALDETSLLLTPAKERFSDRLFRVPTKDGDEVFIWILIEHQSSDQRLMGFRLLEYAVARWQAYRLLHKEAETLPLLIPIVLQHDSRGWTGPVEFARLYSASETLLADVGPYAINFRYYLDDLQTESEADLIAKCPSAALRAVLWALKRRGEIPVAETSHWANLFEILAAEQNIDLIDSLVWYLLEGGSEPVLEAIEQENSQVGRNLANILDRTYDKGQTEGRAEGRTEGRAEEARRLLRAFLEVKSDFSMTPDIEARLQRASTDEIEAWFKRLFLGESPKAVLGA